MVSGWLLGASEWLRQCHLGLFNVNVEPLGSLFVPVNSPLKSQHGHLRPLASYLGPFTHRKPFDSLLESLDGYLLHKD